MAIGEQLFNAEITAWPVETNDQLEVVFNTTGAQSQIPIIWHVLDQGGFLIRNVQLVNLTGLPLAEPFLVPLPEGLLVGVTVGGKTSLPTVGQIYAKIAIIRGAIDDNTSRFPLAAGYLSQGHLVNWPFGGFQSEATGELQVQNQIVNNPSAGSDWVASGRTFEAWEVMQVSATLQTSAVVANRQVQLRTGSLGTRDFIASASATQAASLTVQYLTWIWTTPPANPAGIIYIPWTYTHSESPAVQTVTANLDAGDQWSAITVKIRRWFQNVGG